MKKLLTFYLLLPILLFSFDFQTSWKSIEELNRQQLPKSALTQVEAIYLEAKKSQNSLEFIRASLYKKNYLSIVNEDGELKAISFIQNAIKEAPKAEDRAILTSILAQMYHNYFVRNRYKIEHRTTVKTDKKSPLTWSSQDFLNRIYQLYQESLNPITQATPLKRYQKILTEAKNIEGLHPTLYDFLVFRALNYFQNEASYLHEVEERFLFRDPRAFMDAQTFTQLIFPVKERDSLKYQTTLLYQKLLAFHLKYQHQKALDYINLQRLKFVRANFKGAKKDEYYLAALNRALQSNPDSEAIIALMEYYLQKGDEIEALRYVQQAHLSQNPLVQAEAKSIEATIKEQQLSVDIEEVLPPKRNILTKINYKNIENLYVKIFKLTNKETKELQNIPYYKRIDYIKSLSSIKQLKFKLPKVTDYKMHGTEISLSYYPIGQYIALFSPNKDFKKKSIYQHLTISNLTLLKQRKNNLLILNRTTGEPIEGVKVSLYNRNNRKVRSQKSNKDGFVDFSNVGGFYRVKLEYRGDILDKNNHISRYYNYGDTQPTTSVIFFMDRSLYRPKQSIYFKGLAIKQYAKKEPEVLTNKEVTVTLLDSNNEAILTKEFTTNEYGTFHGSFQAPDTKRLGQMQIVSSLGGYSTFRVEEYKAPKFEVTLKPTPASYHFGDTIKIEGIAKAYAGNPIDGAKVKFKVTRESSFFWGDYARYYPYHKSVEIASGETKSNGKGKFTIEFTALEDSNIDPKKHPSYTYIITADVTDKTGESHTALTTYHLGYVNFNVDMQIKDELERSEDGLIKLSSKNLNGEFIPIRGSIDIAKITPESKLYINRYWKMGDKKYYTKEEFEKLFPHYRYHKKEALEQQIIETLYFDTAKDKTLLLPHLEEGEYLLTLRTYDNSEALTKTKKITITNTQSKRLTNPTYLWHKTETKEYHKDDVAPIVMKSSLPKAKVLLTLEQHKETIYQKWIELKSFYKELIKIKASHRGNLLYHLTMVHDNRAFLQSGTILVPWDDSLKVEYLTFRDKLKPNQKEQWHLKISGKNSDAILAEMVATIYDASLDALYPHHFNPPHLYPYNTYAHERWYSYNFSKINIRDIWRETTQPTPIRTFPTIKWLNSYNYGVYGGVAMDRLTYAALPAPAPSPIVAENLLEEDGMGGDINPVTQDKEALPVASISSSKKANKTSLKRVAIRNDFNATMLFNPNLRSDKEGNIYINFTTNDTLTRWNFLAFVHTKDLKTATTKKSFSTAKELMVTTNLPRFFREHDKITLVAKVVNMSNHDLNGSCQLQLRNPKTQKALFAQEFKKSISLKKGASTSVEFSFKVPSLNEASAIEHTVVVTTDNYSDAERIVRPIVSNRLLVTESKPIFLKPHESKSITLESLKKSNSTTLTNHRLTLEFSSNPAWYAIRSLPYLMEFPHECNEQLFSRYFANAIAAKLANSSPKIKEVFEQWKTKGEVLNALEKSSELKSILIEETPWVVEAKTATEQQRRLSLLFDLTKLAKEQSSVYEKLLKRQHQNGGWAWFESPTSNWYITQYIVEGFGKLKELGIDKTQTNALRKAVAYIDKQMLKEYQELLKKEKDKTVNLEDNHLSSIIIHYLYARSFYDFSMDSTTKKAYQYYLNEAKRYWTGRTLYEQGLIALALNKESKKSALAIVKSLKERAIISDELGAYFKYPNGYFWNQMPIETHTLMMEVFEKVAQDSNFVEQLKIWLLKNKQTNNWKTTKATTMAIYALLKDAKWLNDNQPIELHFKSTTPYEKALQQAKPEAGTGYMKVSFKEFDKNMATLYASNPNSSAAWGALYWQYFEDIDKIKSFKATPLKLKKELFLVSLNSHHQEQLIPIEQQHLKVGDRVKVRVELSVDRDMEYIMLKDTRASAFEPIDVLSQYRYQGALGYYESIKDRATYFFIDYLPKGTYVFEYPLFVTHKGEFLGGITTIESMYAPEFRSHSKGERVIVK